MVALLAAVAGDEGAGIAERFLIGALGLAALWVAWRFFCFLHIIFDREAGHVDHRSIRPFGSSRKHIDLGRVEKAQVQANWDGDGSRLTRLALETVDGPIPLEYGYGPADRRRLESAVNQWLTQR